MKRSASSPVLLVLDECGQRCVEERHQYVGGDPGPLRVEVRTLAFEDLADELLRDRSSRLWAAECSLVLPCRIRR